MLALAGRMEYQLSNYFANPTDLKALASHLPRGSDLNMSNEWGAHFYSTVWTHIGYGRVLLPTSGDVQIRIVIGHSTWYFPNGASNTVLYKDFFKP